MPAIIGASRWLDASAGIRIMVAMDRAVAARRMYLIKTLRTRVCPAFAVRRNFVRRVPYSRQPMVWMQEIWNLRNVSRASDCRVVFWKEQLRLCDSREATLRRNCEMRLSDSDVLWLFDEDVPTQEE
ncbi:hypothetical protein HN018_02735 [Lichenicola cladoniae]|uniref:Uncharacterized protein n=1 Tax=Lichenicola cladoniae TaxID=1484109 RepID=A0A6M8HL92_9PROT|nr:hypothetical protein [Lichenicola cladoniae]NPD68946.1 hypothetical protein [Acetobacteraceae bacterium]QKE89109.1 hypothetical protein HN018_02735 [Lichenicola cladoniae]